MKEKNFRIISDSEDHLKADIIAGALLRQITLNPQEPNVNFIVIEDSCLKHKLQEEK